MSSNYKSALRSPEWHLFREKIIERDGDVCVNCGNGVGDGRILQVHHKYYISGKRPWQYPLDWCVTLCKGCHAAKHGIIRPSSGWEFVSEEDIGDSLCEYCGTDIRYVFTIYHTDYGFMEVGTICCDKLTGTTIASDAKNHDERCRRFVQSSRWKCNRKTGSFSIRQKGMVVTITNDKGGHVIYINGKKGGTKYATLEDARRRAFDVIENGTAQKYLELHGK